MGRERPIIFSGAMVRAILAGRKSQTRRVISAATWRAAGCADHAQHVGHFEGRWEYGDNDGMHDMRTPVCPYGAPGDRLFVRESGWERPERTPKMMREGADTWERFYYDADKLTEQDRDNFKEWGFKRRPAIHMPRWASRLMLEVTAVRAERLHQITEADAIAEGISRIGAEYPNFPNDGWNNYTVELGGFSFNQPTARQCYYGLWDTLNGNWDANPWVWVLEFKRADALQAAA